MLKPQDIVISLKLLALGPGTIPTYPALAEMLGMSVSEVHAGVRRARRCGLLVTEAAEATTLSEIRPSLPAVEEFLCYGLRYVFPAEVGHEAIGIPTAADAAPLVGRFSTSGALPMVWPFHNGKTRGVTLKPLYPSVPEVAVSDQALYEWLALADALRLGQGRVSAAAKEIVRRRIEGLRHAIFAR